MKKRVRHILLTLIVIGLMIWVACNSTQIINTQRVCQDFKYEKQGPLSDEECKKYLKIAPLKGVETRKRAANLFEKLAQKYPASHTPVDFRELAYYLKIMAREDEAWQEPLDVSKLSLDEQINYYIYKLRDAGGSECHVGSGGYSIFKGGKVVRKWKAIDKPAIFKGGEVAHKLVAIGEPAILALADLITDRRPIAIHSSRGSSGMKIATIIYPSGEKVYFLPNLIYRYQNATKEIIKAIKSRVQKTKEKSEEDEK